MGKKQRGRQKKGRQDDSQVRMNFLFQAAHIVPFTTSEDLSRSYIDTMRQTSSRSVSSMDNSLKQSFCKQCSSVLIPGVTCTHRVRSSRQTHVVIHCLQCNGVSRYNILPGKSNKKNTDEVIRKRKRNKKKMKKIVQKN